MDDFFLAATDHTQAAQGNPANSTAGSMSGNDGQDYWQGYGQDSGPGYGIGSGTGSGIGLNRDGIRFNPDTGEAITGPGGAYLSQPGDPSGNQPGNPSADQASADWRRNLGPDLAGHQAISAFASPADLARAYLAAQERLGPAPQEYRLDLPPQVPRDEAQIGLARNLAREIGLSQGQLDRLVRFDVNRSQVLAQAQQDQVIRGLATLRAQWGPAFPAQVDLARRGASAFAPPDLKAFMAADPLVGNNPGLIRLFADLGRRITEDRLVPPGSGAREKTMGELLYPDFNRD